MRFGQNEWDRAARFDRPLTVMLLDIDHFKKINDSYGHDAGDDALRAVSTACKRSLRQQDIWARLGGEEFGVVMVEASAYEAAVMAERLRKAVSKLEIGANGQTFTMTASIGLTAGDPQGETFEDAIRRADEALYRAKQDGRNRVEFAVGEPDFPCEAAAAR